MELEWNTKNKSCYRYHKGDVVITQVNDSNHSTSIRFLNNSWKRITKNQHIVFAIKDSKLYFKQEEPRYGYKLSGNSEDSISRFIKVIPDVLKVTDLEIGSYNLEWDR